MIQVGAGGTVRTFIDEWLRPTVAEIVGDETIQEIRESDQDFESLWEAVVGLKLTTDEVLLGSLSTRFRLKLADLSRILRSIHIIIKIRVID